MVHSLLAYAYLKDDTQVNDDRLDLAEKYSNKALCYAKDNPFSLVVKGLILEEMGEIDQAFNSFNNAKRIVNLFSIPTNRRNDSWDYSAGIIAENAIERIKHSSYQPTSLELSKQERVMPILTY